uniref:Uncharacterized protein n=1 Tax=viral metagenome TaxID=1070528 RepID=A0A6C0CMM1_9ZZZZ
MTEPQPTEIIYETVSKDVVREKFDADETPFKNIVFPSSTVFKNKEDARAYIKKYMKRKKDVFSTNTSICAVKMCKNPEKWEKEYDSFNHKRDRMYTAKDKYSDMVSGFVSKIGDRSSGKLPCKSCGSSIAISYYLKGKDVLRDECPVCGTSIWPENIKKLKERYTTLNDALLKHKPRNGCVYYLWHITI